MRRIVLACYETPGYGGASTATYALYQRMRRSGVPATYLNLVASDDVPLLRSRFGPAFDNPAGLDDVHTYTFRRALDAPQPELAATLRALAPGVVIAVGYIAALMVRNAAPSVPLVFFTAGCDEMSAYTAMGMSVDDVRAAVCADAAPPLFHANEGRAVAGADLVVTHSDLIRDLYRCFHARHAGRIYPDVVWMAEWIHADAAARASLARPFDERDIDALFIASRWDRPEKNYPFVRAIAAACRDLDVHVVGLEAEPPPPATLHGLVTARDDIFALMGRARAVVSPSLFDAAPGILFEAAALGCNVVASRRCGNWQICDEPLLVTEFTPDGFVTAIRRATARPYEDRSALFLNARGYDTLLTIAEVL